MQRAVGVTEQIARYRTPSRPPNSEVRRHAQVVAPVSSCSLELAAVAVVLDLTGKQFTWLHDLLHARWKKIPMIGYLSPAMNHGTLSKTKFRPRPKQVPRWRADESVLMIIHMNHPAFIGHKIQREQPHDGILPNLF